MSKKTFYLFLFLFVIIAFLVRLLILYNFLSFDTSVLQPRSTTDMETYIRLGKTFAKGEYDQVFKYQPFYYTVFIPIILKCFSFQLLPVLICQVIIGTLTVFLGALSAKILFNREAGLITAFCLTFCQTLIFYTPFFLIVTL